MSGRTDPAMLGPARYERRPLDAYDSPPWTVDALLEHWTPFGLIWEPAAGRGAIVDRLRERGHDQVLGTDLAPRRDDILEMDFFAGRPRVWDQRTIHCLVTNPPYTEAERFVRSALSLIDRGYLRAAAFLLRHEWDCAASRADLFDRPSFLGKVVLTRRPRWKEFEKGDKGPRHNFAWVVWDRAARGDGPARLWHASGKGGSE